MQRGRKGEGNSDELEIRNLLARVAHMADDGELEDYMRLYTEDVIWRTPRRAGG